MSPGSGLSASASSLISPKGPPHPAARPQAGSVPPAARSDGLRMRWSVAGKAVPLTDDSKRSGGGQGHRLSRESAHPKPESGRARVAAPAPLLQEGGEALAEADRALGTETRRELGDPGWQQHDHRRPVVEARHLRKARERDPGT